MIQIKISYFASLQETAKLNEESLELTPDTIVSDLYAQLKEKYGFSLGLPDMGVAINDEFTPWTTVLSDGDHVVFIPPVSGG